MNKKDSKERNLIYFQCLESGRDLLIPPCDWHEDGWCGVNPPHLCQFKLVRGK